MNATIKIWCTIIAVMALISGVQWIVIPEFVLYNGLFTLLTIVLLILAFYLLRHLLYDFWGKNFIKKFLESVISVVLISLIMALINFFIVANDRTFDLTGDKIHTLSEQSQFLARQLDSPLIMTLVDERANWDASLKILERYKNYSPWIEIHAVDASEAPEQVQLLGVTKLGQVHLSYRSRSAIANAQSEKSITQSLLKVYREKEFKIYYAYGHGELEMDSPAETGGSYFKKLVLAENIQLMPLDLLQESQIPADADLFMILGAQSDFHQSEIVKMENYYKKGGHFLIALTPLLQSSPPLLLKKFYAKLGVDYQNVLAIDRMATVKGGEVTTPIVEEFNTQYIDFKSGKEARVLFPLAHPLIYNKNLNFVRNWLARTTQFPGSWGEVSLAEVKQGKASYSRDDYKGPLILAALFESKKYDSRIAWLGSRMMLQNQYAQYAKNFSFTLSLINWSLGERQMGPLSRPQLRHDAIFISDMQIQLYFWLVIIIYPFIFFILAIYFYRRKLIL